MSITPEKKQEVIGEYQTAEGDTGSPDVQVAIMTARHQQPVRTSAVAYQGFPQSSRPAYARRQAP